MQIAAVISPLDERIMPIIAGPLIRIRDTETNTERDIPNPAWGLERNRRPTAARALVEQRVDVILTPPGSFCSPSHTIVRQAGIQFWRVPPEVRWASVWVAHRQPAAYELVSSLPARELMRQNLNSILHYAQLYLRDLRTNQRVGGTTAQPAGTQALPRQSLPPEQAWNAIQQGKASILDLRTSFERHHYGYPPGSRHVSLLRHALWPEGPGTIYLCQHAVRSKLTTWRGASEVAKGWKGWEAAGLPVEKPGTPEHHFSVPS